MASRLIDQAALYLDDDGQPCAGGYLEFYQTGTLTPKDVYGEKALSTNLGDTVDLDASGRAETDIWLDGAYRVRLFTADDVQVWSRDNVEAPSELPDPTGEEGAILQVVDGAYALSTLNFVPDYTGADDDDVLTIVAGEPFWTPPVPVTDYDGETLTDAVFKDVRTKSQAVTAAATLVIDYADGPVVELAQAVSITSLSFVNFGSANEWARMYIHRTKDATATARTIAWGSVKWAGGTAPTLTSSSGAIDIIELVSNGTTVYGFSRGLAMA